MSTKKHFHCEFESLHDLLEPKLDTDDNPHDKILANLMSPMLAVAPYFSQSEMKKI